MHFVSPNVSELIPTFTDTVLENTQCSLFTVITLLLFLFLHPSVISTNHLHIMSKGAQSTPSIVLTRKHRTHIFYNVLYFHI